MDKVVCLGEGAGADISATFAIIHPHRCLGLCLIRPNGCIASLNERLSYLSSGYNDANIDSKLFAYIAFLRFGITINEKGLFYKFIK